MDDLGEMVPLGSPVWVWGKFYEVVIQGIFNGTWKMEKPEGKALNYWLGMDSGVIDLSLSDHVPAGVRQLAQVLLGAMRNGALDPFRRRIVAQDGTVKNDGTAVFTPEQLIHMDWLCDNVIGTIPPFGEILPGSQELVRELGVYRDIPPVEKEKGYEDFDHIR